MDSFFIFGMVTRKRLSVQERTRVVLNEEGYTLNSIAKQLKVGRRTVQEIVKKYADNGDVQDRPGRGERRKPVQETIGKSYRAVYRIGESLQETFQRRSRRKLDLN